MDIVWYTYTIAMFGWLLDTDPLSCGRPGPGRSSQKRQPQVARASQSLFCCQCRINHISHMYHMRITSSRVQAVWSFQFSFPLTSSGTRRGLLQVSSPDPCCCFLRFETLQSFWLSDSPCTQHRQPASRCQHVKTCGVCWSFCVFTSWLVRPQPNTFLFRSAVCWCDHSVLRCLRSYFEKHMNLCCLKFLGLHSSWSGKSEQIWTFYSATFRLSTEKCK